MSELPAASNAPVGVLPAASNAAVGVAATFDEFLRDALAVIPAYAPAWTNHNPSDPGITLIELLAYVSEALVYRAQRISPDAKLNLLRLLHGEEWTGWQPLVGRPAVDIDHAILQQVQKLSAERAPVTPQDFEQLAAEFAAARLAPSHSVQTKSLASSEYLAAFGDRVAMRVAPGDMIVVVAPEPALPDDQIEALRREVHRQLEPLCLLTSRLHVIDPVYLDITIGCQITPYHDVPSEIARRAANEALRLRYGPAQPADAAAAERRFGRPVYLSDVAEVIDNADGVDFAEDIELLRIELLGNYFAGDTNTEVGIRIGVYASVGVNTRLGGSANIEFPRLERDPTGEVVAILLRPWELARVRLVSDVH
jgi:hypothetical protein